MLPCRRGCRQGDRRPARCRVRLGNYGVATCRFALSVANDVMPGEQVVLLEATTEGRRFAERPVTIRVGK